jgi:aspartate/methionine/tyrosine aminotransferase
MAKKCTNELADELNAVLSEGGCNVYALLSDKGRRAFFPARGILGQTAEARGSAINATIGTAKEDDGSPLALDCLKSRVLVDSAAFLYAPSYGVQTLREKWAAAMIEKNPSLAGKRFSLPVVTNALTHGLSLAGQMFLDKGDKLILPDLYWDNYELLFVEGCGAKLATYRTFSGRRFNVAGLRRKLLSAGEKKVLLLNFPNNPTGYTATDDEALAIRDAVREAAEAGKRIVAIIDDAYFGLVYEKGVHRESLFALLADLHENVLAVKLDGATKEDYVWGFRVGFITFAMKGLTAAQQKALSDKAAGFVRATISSASNLAQKLLLEVYDSPEYHAEKAEKFATLEKRYRTIRRLLRTHREYRESFEAMPFNSGYFMCVKPKGVDAETVRRHLLSRYGTGVITLCGLLRIAFSSVPTDRLGELFANIDSAVRDIKGGRK